MGTVDHFSFNSVARISAQKLNLATGALSTAALAWKHAHPHFAPAGSPHSAHADAVGTLGGAALRAEFSARLVIAAQTPRVGRLVGAGTKLEDEDKAEWEPDVVSRVDGSRRRQNTPRSGRWASDTPEASPERCMDEEVEASKKMYRSPGKSDDRGGRDGRGTRSHELDQETCAGAEQRRGFAKRTGMRSRRLPWMSVTQN